MIFENQLFLHSEQNQQKYNSTITDENDQALK
jgi:hypothetical protein